MISVSWSATSKKTVVKWSGPFRRTARIASHGDQNGPLSVVRTQSLVFERQRPRRVGDRQHRDDAYHDERQQHAQADGGQPKRGGHRGDGPADGQRNRAEVRPHPQRRGQPNTTRRLGAALLPGARSFASLDRDRGKNRDTGNGEIGRQDRQAGERHARSQRETDTGQPHPGQRQ